MKIARSLAVIAAVVAVAGLASSLPAFAATRAPVRDVSATSAGSSRIDVTWRNPHAAGFRGVVVRVARGSTAPGSPRGGTAGVRAGRARHTAAIAHLQPGAKYSVAVFASYGSGHYAAGVTAHVTTGPAPLAALSAKIAGVDVTLRWQNPTTPGFDTAVIRLAGGASPPSTPADGTKVPLTSGHSARLSRLQAGKAYVIAAWARDSAGRLSRRITDSFAMPGSGAGTATITGRVTDAAGDPLSGALVAATDYGEAALYTAPATSADGRYRLTLPIGRWDVVATGSHATGGPSDATGYAGDEDLVQAAGSATTHASFTLGAGALVRGRVTDPAGNPIAGVAAALEPPPPYVDITVDDGSNTVFLLVESQLTAPAVSGADGVFELRGVAPGDHIVCLTPSAGTALQYVDRCLSPSVLARAGQSVDVPAAALDRAPQGAIGGTITGPDGEPVVDASIDAESYDETNPNGYGFAFTGSDGAFSLAGLAPGKYRLCVGTEGAYDTAATGSAPRCLAKVVVTAGATTSLSLALGRGAAASGRVTGPAGEPLADVTVLLEGRNHGGVGYASTDGDGRWTGRGLPTDSYRLCVSPSAVADPRSPTGSLTACPRTKLRLVAGEHRVGLDAALRVGGALAGTVVDATGAPVPNAIVSAETGPFADDGAGEVFSDAHGRFTVTGLPAGKYRVCAQTFAVSTGGQYACHHGSAQVALGQVTRGVTIKLGAGGSVRVVMRDAGGNAVAGADAVALTECARGDFCNRLPVFSTTHAVDTAASFPTGGDGSVTLGSLAPGDYAVCAFAFFGTTASGAPPTGYGDACSGSTFSITVAAGHTTTVTQVVRPGALVTGTVVGADGEPLRNVHVEVPGSPGDDVGFPMDDPFGQLPGPGALPALQSLTTADGAFAIRGVRPGTVRICFDASRAAGGTSAGGYRDRCLAARAVTAGRTTDLGAVRLAPAGAISGHITIAGVATSNAIAVLFGAQGKEINATGPNRSGYYRLSRVPAGSYRVCFAGARARSQCWHGVAWSGRSAPPSNATAVAVTGGQVSDGIDADLVPR